MTTLKMQYIAFGKPPWTQFFLRKTCLSWSKVLLQYKTSAIKVPSVFKGSNKNTRMLCCSGFCAVHVEYLLHINTAFLLLTY